jgi:putative DNA primase/helicase
LTVPAKVKRATQEYREEMDAIGEFLTERCVLDRAATVNATELYHAYRVWCEGSGNDAVTQRTFGASLGERG